MYALYFNTAPSENRTAARARRTISITAINGAYIDWRIRFTAGIHIIIRVNNITRVVRIEFGCLRIKNNRFRSDTGPKWCKFKYSSIITYEWKKQSDERYSTIF